MYQCVRKCLIEGQYEVLTKRKQAIPYIKGEKGMQKSNVMHRRCGVAYFCPDAAQADHCVINPLERSRIRCSEAVCRLSGRRFFSLARASFFRVLAAFLIE